MKRQRSVTDGSLEIEETASDKKPDAKRVRSCSDGALQTTIPPPDTADTPCKRLDFDTALASSCGSGSDSLLSMMSAGTSSQVQQLAEGLSVLADVNAAAAQGWSVELFPALDPGLTTILHDEVHRLSEWVNAFDLRHQPGDRPHRLTLFLAAARHAKDVTGIYRDGEFARIFDGLGVTTHGALVSEGTIRNWRQRERDADRYDPRRPSVDHMREAWG